MSAGSYVLARLVVAHVRSPRPAPLRVNYVHVQLPFLATRFAASGLVECDLFSLFPSLSWSLIV